MTMSVSLSDLVAPLIVKARDNCLKIPGFTSLDDLSVKISYIALDYFLQQHNQRVFDSIMSTIPIPAEPLREDRVMAAMRGSSGASAAETFMASILMGRPPVPVTPKINHKEIGIKCMRAIEPISKVLSKDEVDLLFALANKVLSVTDDNREASSLAKRKITEILQ